MMLKIASILMFIILFLFTSQTSFASSGGPLIILFNSTGYFIAFVVSFALEYALIVYLFGIRYKKLLVDVVIINTISLLIVHIVLPVVIAASSAFGSTLFPENSNLISAIGTWVFDNQEFSKIAIKMTFILFFVQYILTSVVEKSLFTRIWKKKSIVVTTNVWKVSFSVNALSYFFALIVILTVWHEVL